ncbi:hypothetical protein C9374_000755 [Naegleria lovaniensis]|uniref:Uncharacterized protein n=1 Tax=Naegleria lovaniensis TaxID=51637 RepID=A0AA88GS67_NAELO|nr:uncharacterized protein C9374_013632 [Naegleria lovaniensis]XP_044551897.1 uncharacterized protein C9374_000755 [Naegleria lovaniensis]KAG2372677.1 hypothetical protein C9374_013632 [Naegleria lovaniensis]KAG2387905.1 hypothetical protein C9374_000755 [Naegleria lovaniensis]
MNEKEEVNLSTETKHKPVPIKPKEETHNGWMKNVQKHTTIPISERAHPTVPSPSLNRPVEKQRVNFHPQHIHDDEEPPSYKALWFNNEYSISSSESEHADEETFTSSTSSSTADNFLFDEMDDEHSPDLASSISERDNNNRNDKGHQQQHSQNNLNNKRNTSASAGAGTTSTTTTTAGLKTHTRHHRMCSLSSPMTTMTPLHKSQSLTTHSKNSFLATNSSGDPLEEDSSPALSEIVSRRRNSIDETQLFTSSSSNKLKCKQKTKRRRKSSKKMQSPPLSSSSQPRSLTIAAEMACSPVKSSLYELHDESFQISINIHHMEEAFESILQIAPSIESMREMKRELFLSAYGVYLFLYDRLLDPNLDMSGENHEAQMERLNLVRITKLMMRLVMKNFVNLVASNSNESNIGLELNIFNECLAPTNIKKQTEEFLENPLESANIINFQLLATSPDKTMREKILNTIFRNLKQTGFVACLRLGPDIVGIDYFIFAFYFVEHVFYSRDINHLESFSEELLECIRLFENMTHRNGDSFSHQEGIRIAEKGLHAKDFFGSSNDNIILTFKDWETGVEISLNACMTLVQSMLLYLFDQDRRHEAFLLALHAVDMDPKNIYALLLLYYYMTEDGFTSNNTPSSPPTSPKNATSPMKGIDMIERMETIIKEHGQLPCEHPHFFPLLDVKEHAQLLWNKKSNGR